MASLQKLCLFLFFGIILAVGIADGILSWNGIKPPGNAAESRMPRPVWNWKSVWKGEWTPAVEAWLKNRSWLVHGSGAKYRESTFTWLGRTPPGLVVGKNDRLFLPPTVAARTEEDFQKQERVAVQKLKEFSERYEKMDMKIVVFLIPNAASIFPEETPDWVGNSSERLAFLPDLTRKLQKQGILVFNSKDVMRRAAENGVNVFFKGDHHWTPQGARVASEALAEFVKNAFPEMASSPTPISAYPVAWVHRDWHMGSINRKFGFWNRSAVDRRFGDAYEDPEFGELPSGAPSVAWIGTSFSGMGSPQFFSRASGLRVETYTRNAKGSKFASAWGLKHFESNDGLKPPIVIFEIPEYHLTGESVDGGGFDGLSLGQPPWAAPGVVLDYKMSNALGLKTQKSATPVNHGRFVVTETSASLRLKFPKEVQSIEVSIALSEVRSRTMIKVKSATDPVQGCYDDGKFLKYRFTRKKPAKNWDVGWFNLERGQTLEMGEIRTPAESQ